MKRVSIDPEICKNCAVLEELKLATAIFRQADKGSVGMNSKVNEVMECFNSGFDCSQAILSTYCEELGMDKETALKISCGMAVGIARLGSTCGAVSGAYLVISLKYGKYLPEDNAAKEKTFELIQEFDRQFTAKHGSTNCRELMGVDMRYGNKTIAQEQVKAICPVLVKDAAEILESIL